jgi:hypothetical protein
LLKKWLLPIGVPEREESTVAFMVGCPLKLLGKLLKISLHRIQPILNKPWGMAQASALLNLLRLTPMYS